MTKTKLSPRKEARQRRAKETVRAIVEAATHILNTEGASGFTTNHIAKKAGVSIGSLYQYFPNKDSISSKIFETYVEEQGKRVIGIILQAESESGLDVLIPVVLRELYRFRTEEIVVARAIAYEISRGHFHTKMMEIKKELSTNLLLFLNDLNGAQVNSINQMKMDLMIEGVDNMIFQLTEKELSESEVQEGLDFLYRLLKQGLEELE
jgi:AcrR family transcriptional regulator